jgi:predicted nuclease with TOPRIM domain
MSDKTKTAEEIQKAANECNNKLQYDGRYQPNAVPLAFKLGFEFAYESIKAKIEELQKENVRLDQYLSDKELQYVNELGKNYNLIDVVKELQSQLSSAKYSIEDALKIIHTLMAYGNIRPVEGVVYPEGSHKETLEKAYLFLTNYQKPSGTNLATK